MHFPNENRLENRRLTHAYLIAALKAGATLREESRVDAIETSGGKFSALRLHDGTLLEADVAVNAAGSWASLIRGLEADRISLHPIRGQIVCFETQPNLLGPAIFCLRGYAVPRRDGRLLAGSTREQAGYSKNVTLEGMESIVRAAREMLPALAGIRFREAWAGLRPGNQRFSPCARTVGGGPRRLLRNRPLPQRHPAFGDYRAGARRDGDRQQTEHRCRSLFTRALQRPPRLRIR